MITIGDISAFTVVLLAVGAGLVYGCTRTKSPVGRWLMYVIMGWLVALFAWEPALDWLGLRLPESDIYMAWALSTALCWLTMEVIGPWFFWNDWE